MMRRQVSRYPTRPHKWGRQVIKSFPLAELRAMVEADDLGICPVCERGTADPCPCFEKERESNVSQKEETTD